jgi:uncharacterized protein (TIGR02996 family)
MTPEENFQRRLDANPKDWQARLAFADWLDAQDDPRGPGYRTLAVQRRYPLQGHNKEAEAWWWHCSQTGDTEFHNQLPPDWFKLLPPEEGSQMFWPVFTEKGGIKSRRGCENALALAFAQLPAERQAELLAGPPAGQ